MASGNRRSCKIARTCKNHIGGGGANVGAALEHWRPESVIHWRNRFRFRLWISGIDSDSDSGVKYLTVLDSDSDSGLNGIDSAGIKHKSPWELNVSIAHLLRPSASAEVITITVGIAWRSELTAKENLAGDETRRLSIAAPCYATPSLAAHNVDHGPRTRPTQCARECRICAGCKSSLRPSVTWSGLIGSCHVVFRLLAACQRW